MPGPAGRDRDMKIERLSDIDRKSLFNRYTASADVSGTVAGILSDVMENGDEAVLRYTRRFDGADLQTPEVPAREIDEAADKLDPKLRAAMEKAAENIRAYHTAQKRAGFTLPGKFGSFTGQIVTPIERVGLYIPGGTAAYPSSVFMNVHSLN